MSVRRLFEMPKARPTQSRDVWVVVRLDESDPRDAILGVFFSEDSMEDWLHDYYDRYTEEGETIEDRVKAVLDGQDDYIGVVTQKAYG